MIEIRRILCPIDFSDASRRALGYAAAIAHWYDATLTLFHMEAFQPVGAWGPGTPGLSAVALAPADREALIESLRRFAGSLDESGAVEFDAGIGYAAPGILAKADAWGCDMLVMGTHGRSGFDRLVLGSVTEKVLRKARCPVLTVPPAMPDAVPASPAVFRRILCAVDFSDCSAKALTYAISLAAEASARLTVLHVVELPEMPEGARALAPFVPAIEQERQARLVEAVPEAMRQYCEVDTILRRGRPYQEILAQATQDGSDLIVIGVQGRSAPDLLFFGSTAQHVVRQAGSPVLTLRL